MKRLFLATLLATGIGAAFSSCNNGQYDSNPNANNSGTTNPINQGNNSSGSTYYLRVKVNGTLKNYQPSMNINSGVLMMGGPNTNLSDKTSLGITLAGYTGAGTYTVSGSIPSSACVFSDATSTSNILGYTSSTGSVNVTSDANDIMQGTFTFQMDLAAGTGNPITFSDGEFKIHK